MIYTIIVKAKVGVPVLVENDTLDSALAQAGKTVLDSFAESNVSIDLCPISEWEIREEAIQTVVSHLTQALQGLLDLYSQVGNKIYEEPAMINALAVLLEVEVINTQIKTIQEAQNQRNSTLGNTTSVRE